MTDHDVVELLFGIIGPIACVWVVGYVCAVGEAWERRRVPRSRSRERRRRRNRRIEAQIMATRREPSTGA